jgi:hypothetical protein
MPFDTWTHFAVTFDDNTFATSLFINGVPAAVNNGFAFEDGNQLAIATSADLTAPLFDGEIQNIALYDHYQHFAPTSLRPYSSAPMRLPLTVQLIRYTFQPIRPTSFLLPQAALSSAGSILPHPLRASPHSWGIGAPAAFHKRLLLAPRPVSRWPLVNRFALSGTASNFNLHPLTAAPLPLTLIRFTAGRNDDASVLQWATASEQNTLDFIVERSPDGQHYTSIGTVGAAGNSSVVRNVCPPPSISCASVPCLPKSSCKKKIPILPYDIISLPPDHRRNLRGAPVVMDFELFQ